MSNGLSAAQLLQQAHEAASAPSQSHVVVEDPYPVVEDPFPVAPTPADQPKPTPRQPKQVDVSDESAFPSLGGAPGAAKKAGSLWGAGGSAAQRVRQHLAPPTAGTASGASTPRSGASSAGDEAVSRPGFYSTTVQLAASDIHVQSVGQAGRRQPGTFSNERTLEPTTVGEVLKLLNSKNPTVTAESSTSRAITTFIIKGKGPNAEADVAKVRRELLARLSKKVTIEVPVPAGLRPFIIGGKGKTLKEIQDATGASIQIPPREANEAGPTDDLPDGPLIPISISGESSAVQAAKQKVLAIVAERAAKVQTPIQGVPKEFWPHLSGVKGARLAEILAAAGAEAATINVPNFTQLRGVPAHQAEEQPAKAADKVPTVSGDRELVAKVIAAIEAEVAELRSSLKELAYGVNRAQHRFLVGSNADSIFEETGCSVELPGPDSADDKVTIRGPQDQLVPALQLVIKHASGAPVESLDLSTAHRGEHDRKAYAAHVTRYVLKQGKFKTLAQENGAQVFLPKQASIEAGQPLIEITAPTAQQVAGARTAIIGIVRQLPPTNFAIVEVDSLLHRHLNAAAKGKKLKAVQAEQSVELLFPPERDDRADLLLVYTGTGSAELALDAVKTEVLNLAKQAAEIKTQSLSVPSALHKSIAGPNNTTLNAVIGEDKLVNVAFQGDEVVVRGPADHVARVAAELERLAIEAKDDQVASAHEIEFEIDAAQVRHIVGKAGSGINKLRDDLGVRVDFDDAKKAGGKAKVTIKGRKENALEAKKRIINAAERFADEVTLSIPLPASLERGALIGKQGTYLKRLEDKYEVKINFPKSRADDAAAPAGKSEITVRGGKKGAEQAKGELVALIEYERENGNTVTFTVSVKSLPRILGKAGSTINDIKDENQVQIDVDQADGEGVTTANITIRGTKGNIAKAKTAIQAIAKEVDDEARLTINIPREYHTTLIGSGGSAIRDIIARAGGPADKSGQVVRFPRQGSADEAVLITAPKAVAEKIKAALEEEVVKLQSRVVWGVAVPQSQHASVIGKGASALQELQRKHGVKVVMPGWNDYAQAGEIVNKENVADVQETDIVKIVGPKEAAVAAAADLSKGRPSAPTVRETVQVPRKFHAKIAQGGRFFRSLPSGTRVTHDGQKPPSSAVKGRKAPASLNGSGASTPTARIDDDDAAAPAASAEVGFVLEALYEGAEGQDEGEIPWVVESTSQANADKVVAEIKKQLEQADKASHIAWVTVPKGVMPRIVGRGGSGLDKLRAEGVEVEVVGKRDSNLLTLTGTPETIERAHQAIVQAAAPRERRQYRNDYEDDY